ncbi:MAG: DNA repair protein RadA [Alphaproteobacteria bacterium]|nr:DNA repair protein RadA [Alphaproteobacteria bacterium]MDP6829545.1 DNA repair protein RadA [Alphaproteobacteria bacterium]
MAKTAEQFVCQSCGAVHGKWSGRCTACGEWNSITEEAGREAPPKGLGQGKGRVLDFRKLNQHGELEGPRTASGLGEFDRVCGGGLVPGSAVLIGGDPGIGKSTILLQVVARLAKQGIACAYISGEEAPAQVRMRARRLGLEGAPLDLAAATSVRDIVATLDGPEAPHVVVIDSIQTMYVDSIESAPGTVSQVRASAQELIRAAKRRDICLLLVGHVTKDGQIAGPRVLEHMVDSVLYFEGERGHQFRILRAVKNRFGPTDEIGVFEMSDAGLMEVSNPSALFLANRGEAGDISGSAVFAGLEGSRPVLVEIQALVAPSPPGNPRRTVVGWDGNRLAMVLAVLDARCGLGMAGHDVYLNVAGGLRINEPAADLAVAAALVSSLMEVPVPREAVLFGEISLSGEVRPVAQAELRMKEAAKLGFTRALAPPTPKVRKSPLTIGEISRLPELVELFASDGVKAV